MILFIDYREKKFIDILNTKGDIEYIEEKDMYILKLTYNSKQINIKYKIINLDIGDFLIINESQEDNEDNINKNQLNDINYIYNNLILLIERKTINDLSSSIIDGRFREQKSRIEKTLNDNNKIMYILEGMHNKLTHGISLNILNSAILNMIFKHKFKLLNCDNINHTCDIILNILKKYIMGEFKNEKCDTSNDTVKSNEIHLINIKKSDRIKSNLFNLQLSVIPGISMNIAEKISNEYKNMNELFKAYNEIDNSNIEEKYHLLANIQITEKRKLGKALSKKIYNALNE